MQHPHNFTVGQTVELCHDRYDRNLPSGAYTITRLLPNDAEDREYRVKSSHDGHERVVRESQLRAGTAPVFGFGRPPAKSQGGIG
ncbi:hypothetical protein JYK14_00550 [Siccirubricoccus sp. KC 17139]|uniref:Uncharacterized protein n=1 Tax=Siccirubricoccus soli TaxID=2899147 RepID=A0ABT1D059_9PROT|nr:hypothetical protein [Siccirubricoccus soli]MCO6414670.1 hypothetical protein [Siccirubricoccus soli]MCP2680800.1 hypothetical protein [Siccirubricoccus soli]